MRDRKPGWSVAIGGLAVLVLFPGPVWAEQGGRQLNPGDIGHALAAMAIFVVLLLVLRKWAWRPIIAQLRRREEDIADALRRAQQREKEALDLLSRYKARLARAEAESGTLLAESR